MIGLFEANMWNAAELTDLEKSVANRPINVPITNIGDMTRAILKHTMYRVVIIGEERTVGLILFERPEPGHAYLAEFSILPWCRCHGYGTEALRIALTLVSDVNYVDLLTHPRNIGAMRLYKRFGFRSVGLVRTHLNDGIERVRMIRYS